MILRPRQQELVTRAVYALNHHGNTLGVAPTGAGKTVMLSAIVKDVLSTSPRQKACILAHRDELTAQNQDKFRQVNPHLSTSIFDASEKSWEGSTTFAMVQTLSRETNLKTMPPLDVLVIDEAHHARAESYQRIIHQAQQQNAGLKLLGMTATANRGDKKGLGSLFSNVCDQITIEELIASGHLVPPKTFVMDVGVRDALKQVKKTGDEYDMGAVSQIMDTYPVNDAVVHHWKEKAGTRQTVVFCSTVQHALHVTQSFIKEGIAAVTIHGDMGEKEREQTLLAYASGAAQVVVNVGVLTEGWDHPPTSCVVLLRPSSYKSTMIQMIGRGLRIAPPADYPDTPKTDCIILDFGTSSLFHGCLEDQINLKGKEPVEGEAPSKQCPECLIHVPAAVLECPLCGHLFESDKKKTYLTRDEFTLREIELIKKRSPFMWINPDHTRVLMASGFNVWSGVFAHHQQWVALGAFKKQPAKVLAIGQQNVCLSAANDFMNLHESETTSHKFRGWLYLSPSEEQMKWLPQKYHDLSLNRYEAGAFTTFAFNQKYIQQALKEIQA